MHAVASEAGEPGLSPFYLGRQPILDRGYRTVAYELLFRNGSDGGAVFEDHRTATATVIAHAFSELGIDAVLGSCQGFINFDAELLLSEVPELLPASRMVLELLETVEVTPAVVARCRQLHGRGFRLALDDVPGLDARHQPILPFVHVVKVDLPSTPPEALPSLVQDCHQAGLQALAEKVDSRAQAEACHALGFDLFQGYFFARPAILAGRTADPSRRLLLRLLQQVLGQAENAEIEQTFKQAPDLSYKLMRLVNSVGMGMSQRIESLAHALVVLGRRQLQRWLQVLVFAHHSAGDFPSPLLTLAATRGKLMELIAEHRQEDRDLADAAFMTGILSLLDTLLDMPMAELLDQISTSDEVRAALLGRTGRLGQLLRAVEGLEQATLDPTASTLIARLPCSPAELARLQICAMRWAEDIARPMD